MEKLSSICAKLSLGISQCNSLVLGGADPLGKVSEIWLCATCKTSHQVLLSCIDAHAARAARCTCCSVLLWCMSMQNSMKGNAVGFISRQGISEWVPCIPAPAIVFWILDSSQPHWEDNCLNSCPDTDICWSRGVSWSVLLSPWMVCSKKMVVNPRLSAASCTHHTPFVNTQPWLLAQQHHHIVIMWQNASFTEGSACHHQELTFSPPKSDLVRAIHGTSHLLQPGLLEKENHTENSQIIQVSSRDGQQDKESVYHLSLWSSEWCPFY